jgi:hypothetical protein
MDKMEVTLRIGWSHIKSFQKARRGKATRLDDIVDRQADQSSFK